MARKLEKIIADAHAAKVHLESAGLLLEAHATTELSKQVIGDICRAAALLERVQSKETIISVSEIDLEHMLQVVVGRLESQLSGISVKIQNTSDVPQIINSEDDLEGVLTNLIKNAAEALNYSPNSSREIDIHLSKEGEDSVIIVVSDSGPGLAENVKQLFNQGFIERRQAPRSSTKREGRGYGLGSIIDTLNMIGGRIDLLEDGSASGAAFKITLKVNPEDEYIRLQLPEDEDAAILKINKIVHDTKNILLRALSFNPKRYVRIGEAGYSERLQSALNLLDRINIGPIESKETLEFLGDKFIVLLEDQNMLNDLMRPVLEHLIGRDNFSITNKVASLKRKIAQSPPGRNKIILIIDEGLLETIPSELFEDLRKQYPELKIIVWSAGKPSVEFDAIMPKPCRIKNLHNLLQSLYPDSV